MNINKESAIYRFMDEGMIRENKIMPQNLCAFMRSFVFSIVMTIIIWVLIGWCVFMTVMTPIYLLMGGWVESFNMFLIFGLIFDMIAIVLLTAYLAQETEIGGKVGKIIIKQGKKAADTSVIKLFASWARAVHDKVCPVLNFK